MRAARVSITLTREFTQQHVFMVQSTCAKFTNKTLSSPFNLPPTLHQHIQAPKTTHNHMRSTGFGASHCLERFANHKKRVTFRHPNCFAGESSNLDQGFTVKRGDKKKKDRTGNFLINPNFALFLRRCGVVFVRISCFGRKFWACVV